MKYFILSFVFLFVALTQSYAGNYPCSGRKGGISHCVGSTFVCNDGSVSASTKNCSAYMGGSSNSLADRSTTTDMAPSASNDCSCRSGSYCVGPRGGHYCYTDSGNKSYLRRN